MATKTVTILYAPAPTTSWTETLYPWNNSFPFHSNIRIFQRNSMLWLKFSVVDLRLLTSRTARKYIMLFSATELFVMLQWQYEIRMDTSLSSGYDRNNVFWTSPLESLCLHCKETQGEQSVFYFRLLCVLSVYCPALFQGCQRNSLR